MWARVTDRRSDRNSTERHKTIIKREKEPRAGGGGKINKAEKRKEKNNEKLEAKVFSMLH